MPIDAVEEPVQVVATKPGLESEDVAGAEVAGAAETGEGLASEEESGGEVDSASKAGERLESENKSGADEDAASKAGETYLPTSDVRDYSAGKIGVGCIRVADSEIEVLEAGSVAITNPQVELAGSSTVEREVEPKTEDTQTAVPGVLLAGEAECSFLTESPTEIKDTGVHGNEQPYSQLDLEENVVLTTCSGCKSKFTYTSVLLEHLTKGCDMTGQIMLNLKNKKSNNKLACNKEKCFRTYQNNMLEFAKHMDRHFVPGLLCSVCNRAMSSPADFTLHLALMHQEKLAIQETQQADKQYEPFCSGQTETLSNAKETPSTYVILKQIIEHKMKSILNQSKKKNIQIATPVTAIKWENEPGHGAEVHVAAAQSPIQAVPTEPGLGLEGEEVAATEKAGEEELSEELSNKEVSREECAGVETLASGYDNEKTDKTELAAAAEVGKGLYSKEVSGAPEPELNAVEMLTTCSGCKRKFTFVSVMLEHLKRGCDLTGSGVLCLENKKTNNKLVCKEENCNNKNFHNLLKYAKHRDTHTFPGLICAICKRGMSSPADFALHMSLIHPDILAMKKTQKENKREVPLWSWEPQVLPQAKAQPGPSTVFNKPENSEIISLKNEDSPIHLKQPATTLTNVPSLNILPFTSFPYRPLIPMSMTPKLSSSIGKEASENEILNCKQRRRRSGTNKLKVCVPQTSSNLSWDFLLSEARCRLVKENTPTKDLPLVPTGPPMLMLTKRKELFHLPLPASKDLGKSPEISKELTKQHLLKKRTQQVQICIICARHVASFDLLKQHDRIYHMKIEKDGTSYYKCNQCSETFIEKPQVYKHITQQHNKCMHCGKGFLTKRTLDTHMAVNHKK